MRTNRNFTRLNEAGAATLYIVLVLLLLASLVVFFTARNAINEQRISANEIRSKQAFDAASAGLNYALADFAKGGLDLDLNVPATTGLRRFAQGPQLYANGGRQSFYQVVFCSPSYYSVNALPGCPASHGTTLSCNSPSSTVSGELRAPIILSCGWSDDDGAVMRQVSRASGTPSLPGNITSPVITRGATNLLVGGASIFNYFNDLTVWAGGQVPIQSNTGKSFVRDISTDPSATSPDYRNTGNSPGCNNPPQHYTCSTDGNNLGPDVISVDSTLSSKSTGDFFESLMGKQPDAYRDTVATYKVDLNNSLTGEDSSNLNSLVGQKDQVIWVAGDASNLGNIGTADHPVILVIDGNLDLSSNTVINGLVFVTGNITGNGTPTIYGTLIGTGTANISGNLKVIYDPNVLGNAMRLGKTAMVPGSWRDW